MSTFDKRNRDFCKALTDMQFAYVEAEAENAKLLESNKKWMGKAARFEEKNAKLRELVQKMMRFLEDGDWCTTCEVVKECEAQEQYEGDCLMRGVFHDRMRELGIKVD